MWRERDEDVNRFENIVVEPGLRAYRVPDMEKTKLLSSGELAWISLPDQEAQQNLNTILASITRQGGELKGVITLDVTSDDERNGHSAYKRPFLIIEKK